jgi:hypothetical protein
LDSFDHVGDAMTETPSIQIAVDCADPHRLARFWAGALGYEVEADEEGIRQILAAGYATDEDVTEYEGVLVWKTAAACRDPEGRRPRMLFQHVPEPKTVKNRLHLDLRVGAERQTAEVERLAVLGASVLWEASQGPLSWVTMADPEGNEFCVT